MADIEDGTDLYELFGVKHDATKEVIVKAYRKTALKYHPDKNPDNPKAHEIFAKFTKAYETLLDPERRKAYDDAQRAKRQRKERMEAMDTKRKDMKNKLEERENAWKRRHQDAEEEARRVQMEVEKLRNEGLKRRKQMDDEAASKIWEATAAAAGSYVPAHEQGSEGDVKITWSYARAPYTEEQLRAVLGVFGAIEGVVVGRKSSSAVVSFASADDAARAIAHYARDGLEFKAAWPAPVSRGYAAFAAGDRAPSDVPNPFSDTLHTPGEVRAQTSHAEYEMLVLQRMRQAAQAQKARAAAAPAPAPPASPPPAPPSDPNPAEDKEAESGPSREPSLSPPPPPVDVLIVDSGGVIEGVEHRQKGHRPRSNGS
eukprot:tig00001154_g7296.t1